MLGSSWLYDLCRGMEHEPVKPRQLPKSIGCSKNFRGKTALVTQKQVQHWLLQLALELEERLNKDRDQNSRVAKQLTIGIHMQGCKHGNGLSRCCALANYDAHKISRDAFALIQNCNTEGGQQAVWSPPITLLQLSASKFSEARTSSVNITSFLTTDSQGTQATCPSASSPNGKSLESPQKETLRKKINPIQMLFQRAVEKKQAQAMGRNSLPAVSNERTLPSMPESSVCQDKRLTPINSQALKAPAEESITRSNPDCMQKGLSVEQSLASSEAGLLETPLETEVPEVSSELPDLWKEKEVQPAAGVSQAEADSWALQLCTDDTMLCEKCNQQVLIWEFTEHSDYHFAVELQNSFSGTDSFRPSLPPASPPAKGKSKQKTPTVSRAKRPRQSTDRTLDFFFKRSPP